MLSVVEAVLKRIDYLEAEVCREAKVTTVTVAGFTICSLKPVVTIWGNQFIASTSSWLLGNKYTTQRKRIF